MKAKKAEHRFVGVGHCGVCDHYGEDCTGEREELAIREQGGGDTPANRLRAGRNLAAVQRLQSEFWQALRELEDVIGEIRNDECELDGAKDFNDLDLDNVIEGHGDDGEDDL